MMTTPKSHLSIPHRVEMLRAGLMTKDQIRDLISDALAQNMLHYLPTELREYGAALVKKGELVVPES